MKTLTPKEFGALRITVALHAKTEAEGDLLFSGCKPLAKLSEDERKTVCEALKHYAETGAMRAIDNLKAQGFITVK